MSLELYKQLIDLLDPDLFGNEAAEDEDAARFRAYFVEKPEFPVFESSSLALGIVRARKGVGKSALLRRVADTKSAMSENIVMPLVGSDLVAQRPFKCMSPHELVYDWQQRICFAINIRLGKEIGFALDDDEMSLVEASELSGFRSKNIVGALLDRLGGKLGSLSISKKLPKDAASLLARYEQTGRKKTIWILIDDIDATFINKPDESLRVSTFFSACRLLTNSVSGLRIRASVRADVWASVRSTDEALDKCEQYMLDLKWSRSETGSILAGRIRSYLAMRHANAVGPIAPERKSLIGAGVIRPSDITECLSDQQCLSLIFPRQFAWATNGPHHVIHVLSAGRPRWALQLCKMAASEARRSSGSNIIKFGFVSQILEKYGQFRIDDIIREHRHQCPEIQELIHGFARQRVRYTTEQLINFIDATILSKMCPTIDDCAIHSALQVGHFLFKVDFVNARDETRRSPIFYRFTEKPHLLKTLTNLDEGLEWEIHPAFRQALNLTGPGADFKKHI